MTKKRKQQLEYTLQKMTCRYVDLQYPDLLYQSDTIASVRLTIPQQVRNKAIQKEGFKCPDMMFFEPRGGYTGLFIELKVKSPFKLNGDLYKCEHLEGQARSIEDLKRRGYYACFAWGFDMVKEKIDEYMKLESNY